MVSAATIEIVLGDGRLSLEREVPQRFDVLVVDVQANYLDTCALTTSGGVIRSTRSAVQLMIRPASRQRATSPRPGAAAGTPADRDDGH